MCAMISLHLNEGVLACCVLSVFSANSSGLSSAAGTSSVGTEFGVDYVKMAGETIGITGLPDDCASQVASSTTYVFKEIVEQARKFAVHGRRKRLVADDIDDALASKGRPVDYSKADKNGSKANKDEKTINSSGPLSSNTSGSDRFEQQ
uniref:TATA box binding protein associated factor (TAF) histone-like fold domain-containing protein n=1 Tax=Parascaris equorum TaxID=6256 RepID=A0A914R3H2_PAREQ